MDEDPNKTPEEIVRDFREAVDRDIESYKRAMEARKKRKKKGKGIPCRIIRGILGLIINIFRIIKK